MNDEADRPTAVVLGIDAAWTLGRPSGVALAVRRADGWSLAAVAPSYDHVLAIAHGEARPASTAGSMPDAGALLDAGRRIAGAPVDLVAIDMPLSLAPIVGRRRSDDAIASAFGARHCATHSPSLARPGPLSDRLRAGFAAAGYLLRTRDATAGGLIEVYPHPALVVLAGAARRLPYKAGNTARYWPGQPLAVRRGLLHTEWRRIADLLATRFGNLHEYLPPLADRPSGRAAKAHEDMLDAIVCAWVGTTALAGDADAHGDDESAIWVPRETAR